MNRIYRSVWNASRGCFVAAHEHASAHSKSSTTRTVAAIALLTLGSGQAMAQTTYTAANTSYERVSSNVVSYYCDDWYGGHSVGDSTCDDDSGHWYGPSNLTDNSPAVGTVTGTAVLNAALGNNAVILSNAQNGAVKRSYGFTSQGLFPDEVWLYVTRTATYNYASTWTANLTGNNVNVAAVGGVSISTASGITSNLALTGTNTFAGSVTLTGTLSQTAGSTNFQGAVVAPTTSLTGGSVDFDSTLNTNNLTMSGLGTANFDGAVTATGTVGITNTGSINFHNGLSAAGFSTLQNTGTLAGNISNTGSSALNIQGGSGSIVSNTIGSDGMRSTLPGDFGTLTGSANNTVGTISSTGANVNLSGNLLLNDHIVATGHTVTNNGTLLLSNTATALNITGNFTNAGTYVTTVDSDTGNYSRLAVSGNVALGGKAFVNVLGSGTLAAGSTLSNVISAGGALSGTFSSIEDNSYLYNFTGVYGSTSFGLKVVAAGSGAGNGGALINADASNLSWASGNVTVANGTTVSSSTSAAAFTLSGGSLDNQGTIQGTTAIEVGSGATGNITNTGSITGDIHNAGSNALNIQGASGSISSNVISNDGSVNSSPGNAPNSAKIDLFQLIGYGSYALDANKELTWQVDVGHNSNRGRRSISFMGSSAASSYSSLTMHAGLGMGWSVPLSEKTTLLPSVRADYARIQDDGYAETGAGLLNLNVEGRSNAQMLWSADGKIHHRLDNGITLIANAGIGYDSLNQRSTVVAAFAGDPGASFATEGLSQSPWVTHAGLGVSTTLANGTVIMVRYDGEYRTGFDNQTASVKAKWMF